METPEEAAFADATRNQLNPLDEEMVRLHIHAPIPCYEYEYIYVLMSCIMYTDDEYVYFYEHVCTHICINIYVMML